MRIIQELEEQSVCGMTVMVPMGENCSDFSKIVSFNDAALFLWNNMVKDDFDVDSLAEAMLKEYDVDEATARQDVKEFLDKLKEERIIE